jgi:hypothetical protein
MRLLIQPIKGLKLKDEFDAQRGNGMHGINAFDAGIPELGFSLSESSLTLCYTVPARAF